MSESKAKKSKTNKKASKALPGPGLATLSVQPIPDFDPAEMRKQAEAVVKDVKAAVRLMQDITGACEAIGSSDALLALAADDKAAKLGKSLLQLRTELPQVETTLNRLKDLYDVWHSGERRSRRMRFEALAREMNWKICGSWPEPVINGIVFVNIDEGKDQAHINGQAVSQPVTAERLIAMVFDELEVLTTNLTNSEQFTVSLWKAYRARGVQPPDGIDVFDLLAELTWQRQGKAFQRDPRSDSFRGYALSQFRADLTNCLESNSPKVSDKGKCYELEVVGGSFAQDGLFMYFPQTGRLATCGRLSFRLVDRKGES